ncbi:uncharacterized protein RBU33_007898 [Hipposideros larvatus]
MLLTNIHSKEPAQEFRRHPRQRRRPVTGALVGAQREERWLAEKETTRLWPRSCQESASGAKKPEGAGSRPTDDIHTQHRDKPRSLAVAGPGHCHTRLADSLLPAFPEPTGTPGSPTLTYAAGPARPPPQLRPWTAHPIQPGTPWHGFR